MKLNLHRSSNNRIIFGVCSGLAESTKIDVSIVRIILVLLTVFSQLWIGVLIYCLAYFLMPEDNEEKSLFEKGLDKFMDKKEEKEENKKEVHKVCMNCKHVVISMDQEGGTSNYVCTLNENVTDAESNCNKYEQKEEE